MIDDASQPNLVLKSNAGLDDKAELPHQNVGKVEQPSFFVSSRPSTDPGARAAFFRPSKPVILPTSDINIDFERRNKATYGLTMVTSVAHVWFNAFFESQFSSTNPSSFDFDNAPANIDPPFDSGVFSITWEAMDGIRGSTKKGIRALDRLSIVWRAVPHTNASELTKIITEPQVGEPVPETGPTDLARTNSSCLSKLGKGFGLRVESPARGLSKANSIKSVSTTPSKARADDDDDESVKACGPRGEQFVR